MQKYTFFNNNQLISAFFLPNRQDLLQNFAGNTIFAYDVNTVRVDIVDFSAINSVDFRISWACEWWLCDSSSKVEAYIVEAIATAKIAQ